jgi:hypothetical protein
MAGMIGDWPCSTLKVCMHSAGWMHSGRDQQQRRRHFRYCRNKLARLQA